MTAACAAAECYCSPDGFATEAISLPSASCCGLCPGVRFGILFTDTVIGHVKEMGLEAFGDSQLLRHFGSLWLGLKLGLSPPKGTMKGLTE